MRKLKIDEYTNLPLNDPRKKEIGELFIMRYDEDAEPRDVQVGDLVQIFEVIRPTKRGHESKLVMFRLVK